jgi:hypothetical protein
LGALSTRKNPSGFREDDMNFVKQLRWLVLAATIIAPTLAVAPAMQAQVAVGISVGFPPPELPVYEQPICPGDDYIWTPGYWAWDPEFGDYYWVPGTWVLAPQPGFLWTPGYWGWSGEAFAFYPGYWGPRVGFYGGVSYGFGYFGHGYEGGRWEGGHFYYNRTVNNIKSTETHNVYITPVVNRNETRVSFNGGNGGINARATEEEQAAARERHVAGVAAQEQQVNAARADRSLRASENHGKPPVAATSRAGAFSGEGVVAARSGGSYNPRVNRGGNGGGHESRPPSAGSEAGASRSADVHPNDLPKVNRSDRPPNSGNAKTDQKYQQQVDKMYQKQEQEHQELQQKQDQEHAKAAQNQETSEQKQQMEQRHQQQTQQMQQRHTQDQQKMERQAPQPKAQPPHGAEPRR